MIRPVHDHLPLEFVFHPSWWNGNCGISFVKEFFFDPLYRVECEQKMEQYLYERFGDLGLGRKDAVPRPVAGTVHLAAGFIVSQILGCEIRYSENASPDVLPANLTDEEVMGLSVSDFERNAPFLEVKSLMDSLSDKYGYVEGDFDWAGVQNIALDLRGQQLFIDYYDNPELAKHLFDVISETLVKFVRYIRNRTGTSSLSVNRSVGRFAPSVNLHSNCSIAMISPAIYNEFLLSYDCYLSQNLQPYGIHHCGNNMHLFAESYGRVGGVSFYDVGWGSDVAVCREKLPDAFLNLRLSPVKLLSCTPAEVKEDVDRLAEYGGSRDNVGFCCINMDYGTPDENVRMVYEAVKGLKDR